MRRKVEFYCDECNKYFDIKLNISLNGNHRIHCPNCGHIHFRKIENGEITDYRFDRYQDDPIVDDLCPMKAACRDFSKETAEEYQEDPKGYMKRLWKDYFSYKT